MARENLNSVELCTFCARWRKKCDGRLQYDFHPAICAFITSSGRAETTRCLRFTPKVMRRERCVQTGGCVFIVRRNQPALNIWPCRMRVCTGFGSFDLAEILI